MKKIGMLMKFPAMALLCLGLALPLAACGINSDDGDIGITTSAAWKYETLAESDFEEGKTYYTLSGYSEYECDSYTDGLYDRGEDHLRRLGQSGRTGRQTERQVLNRAELRRT